MPRLHRGILWLAAALILIIVVSVLGCHPRSSPTIRPDPTTTVTIPIAPRSYPYDGLRLERLAGEVADARHRQAVIWQKQENARHQLAVRWQLMKVAVGPNLNQTLLNLSTWNIRYTRAHDLIAAKVAQDMYWHYRAVRAKEWARPKPPPPPKPAPTWGQHVEQETRRYLDIPYVWGGASRGGVDCSGLTMLVYRHLGIYLPHLARGQQAYGYRVQSPAKGDLVFFGYPAHHVGMYIGNGLMIHAPHTGDYVKVARVYQNQTSYRRYR